MRSVCNSLGFMSSCCLCCCFCSCSCLCSCCYTFSCLFLYLCYCCCCCYCRRCCLYSCCDTVADSWISIRDLRTLKKRRVISRRHCLQQFALYVLPLFVLLLLRLFLFPFLLMLLLLRLSLSFTTPMKTSPSKFCCEVNKHVPVLFRKQRSRALKHAQI